MRTFYAMMMLGFIFLAIAFAIALLSCVPPPTPVVVDTCPAPPKSFLGVPLVDCLEQGEAQCCGYGFRQPSDGAVCFHLVCQPKKCETWVYYETQCVGS